MDSSSSSGTSFVVLSVSIVGILATALLLLSYYLFLTRCGLLFFWRSSAPEPEHGSGSGKSRGLQAAAIRRIPTFRYHGSSTEDNARSDCAVCLAGFRDGERLRLLPPCRHAFHIDCIDVWLQASANCPLCRATVASIPVPVPEETETAGCYADTVIEISSSPSSPAAEQEQEQQPTTTRGRRSLSMDALQGMLHHQDEDDQDQDAAKFRSLRRSFFSFSHSRSATILPI